MYCILKFLSIQFYNTTTIVILCEVLLSVDLNWFDFLFVSFRPVIQISPSNKNISTLTNKERKI